MQPGIQALQIAAASTAISPHSSAANDELTDGAKFKSLRKIRKYTNASGQVVSVETTRVVATTMAAGAVTKTARESSQAQALLDGTSQKNADNDKLQKLYKSQQRDMKNLKVRI